MTRKRPTDGLVLQQFLPYLTNRAGVKTGLVFSQDLRAFGISLADWRILIALWDNANLRLNEVADLIVSDLSTVSRQVRALARVDLIARTQSATDRRALNLVLTAKGRAVTAKIIPIARLHEQIATSGIDVADLAVIRRGLTKIYENLHAFERRRANGLGPDLDA